MTATDSRAPRFVLFKEACRYGGFGKQKAYDLIRAGKIDARKMGFKTIIDLDSVDRYHASLPKLELARESA